MNNNDRLPKLHIDGGMEKEMEKEKEKENTYDLLLKIRDSEKGAG